MNIEEDRSGILYDVNKMIRNIECPPISFHVSEEDVMTLLKRISKYLKSNEIYDLNKDIEEITDSIDSIMSDLEDTKYMVEELKK